VIVLFALMLAPASLSQDDLAVCMWQKMPTSTAAFVDNTDDKSDFTLYVKATAPCKMPKYIQLNKLKKILVKTRPAVIAADVETSDNAFVCSKDVPDCKPAGE